ncbi:HAD-IA family hydrolase [Rhodocaloribacter litoris]|uniref:HAD-IA family hydrolase n=1 Tax=Rhodocaloribacter litoris TaxID=2558931 RepID=UPI001E5E4FEA|nr:HAD-IA family hydrolase [Rhodocaloribacter litoris]QXD16807.1 HAD-IA family hydrolase [Rhodocaloribacter litoris]
MPAWTCDALLFDLDGVLVDSHAVIERHWRRWAARHGVDEEALLRDFHGRRMVDLIRRHAPHLNAEVEAARLAREEGLDTDGVRAFAGAAELLRALPAGAWAVVTSGNRLTATTRLRHTGLPWPRVLVTADDVRRGKPDPEPYLRAAEALGVAPGRCLVLEDAPAGIDAAKAAGMTALALTTTHPPGAFPHADAVARRLADLRVHPDDAGRLRVTLDAPV